MKHVDKKRMVSLGCLVAVGGHPFLKEKYMSNRKAVFFDIDGTLWDWSGFIPESTRYAIKKLVENGHVPVICSGRAKGHIRDEALLGLGFKGIIAACGDYVEIDDKIIFEQTVEPSLVKKVVDASIKYNVPIVLEGSRYHWISGKGFEKDDFVDRMIEVMKEDVIVFREYTSDMLPNKIAGDVLNASDYETFKKEMEPHFTFIEHGIVPNLNQNPTEDPNEVKGVFEMVIPGTSKAVGIEKVCKYLGIAREDTVAVGDSFNDVEMIEYAGTGIAMGNSRGDLKELADYVTTDIMEDGIKNAMEHFGLI